MRKEGKENIKAKIETSPDASWIINDQYIPRDKVAKGQVAMCCHGTGADTKTCQWKQAMRQQCLGIELVWPI